MTEAALFALLSIAVLSAGAGGGLYLGSLTSLPAGETLDSIRKAATDRWAKEQAKRAEAEKTVGG